MKKELVVKDNALINASYSLSLVEQRLVLLAIIVARKHDNEMELDFWLGRPIKVTAESYENHFNVTRQGSYLALKEACRNLFERRFSYQEERDKGIAYKVSRWVSDIAYVDSTATVEITFTPSVLPLITRLEKHFTSYELEQVGHLTSPYAVRLYEIVIAWRSIGKSPIIELSEFRNRIGVLENEYQRMELFKRRVLEPAIVQINEHTDITVNYEQHKKGRSITGFSFKFKQKDTKAKALDEQRDCQTIDMFFNMTDAQVNSFGNQLSELPALSYLAKEGESYKDLADRIKKMLRDPEKQQILRPHLKQLGFK